MRNKFRLQPPIFRENILRSALWIAPITLFMTALFLVGCNLPNPTSSSSVENLLASVVAATMQVLNPTLEISSTQMGTPIGSGTPGVVTQTPPSLSPTNTLAPMTGKVSGLVCYIQSSVTNLVAYFQNANTNVVTQLSVAISNYQAEYSLELEPGVYIAYAWNSDFSIGGTYSACGAASGCGDASPRQITVTAGQKLDKIDICDWSHGPFDVPYPPGFQMTSQLGIISGGIYGYPYGSLPQLKIIAFNKSTGYWYMMGTVVGQSYFSMEELPPGSYQVVAYDNAGHAGGSTTLTTVTGGETTNADINDWSSSFPVDPSK
jgi:hypothetical protein